MSYLDTLEQVQVEEVVAPPVKKKRGRKVPEGRDEAIGEARFVHGDSVKEIAEGFSLSVAQVYNILRKGKQQQ